MSATTSKRLRVMPAKIDDLRAFLALTLTPKITPTLLRKLQKTFTPLQDLFLASPSDLLKLGYKKDIHSMLLHPNWRAADEALTWAQQPEHHLLCWHQASYPSTLKHIHSPPPLLYLKGHMHCITSKTIAIIGSRNPTPNGVECAFEFAASLARKQVCISSGLAIGIDSAGHKGALSANGQTLAVLGSGLNQIYPKRNTALAHKICEKGALISEFPLDMSPIKKNFPRRNRIISGLSEGILIPEANLRSGSMITANFALEQGRDVYAVPGSIHNPLSKGCHQLLRQGATLVETPGDLLKELSMEDSPIKNQPDPGQFMDKLDKDYQKLVKCVDYATTSVEKLIKRSHLGPNIVVGMLMELESSGLIKAVTGGYVRIVNERNIN